MVDDDNEICNTRLGLGIGLDDFVPKRDDHHLHHHHHQKKKITSKRVMSLDLSFPFHDIKDDEEKDMMEMEMENKNGYIINKTEGPRSKINVVEEEGQSTTTINNADDHDNNGGGGRSCARKKLRLTQEQSTVLEDSFKRHTTLNTAQKQALSEKLSLKPRQVEVWFQNRRARTKLKQTEVDCEFLKKYCEKLSDENRRLKKEVQELRSSLEENTAGKPSPSPSPFFVQLQNSSTMCLSCQKMVIRSTATTTTSTSAVDADNNNTVAVHKPKALTQPKRLEFFSS